MAKDVDSHRQPGCWLRSSHTFKECVIAHWSSDFAPKISGAKLDTEAVDRKMVEEHCVQDEGEAKANLDSTEERMLA